MNKPHWFSAPRISRYSHHFDPEQLYIYNSRITKELLVDIGHLEVLLRNAIDPSLSATYGTDWFLSLGIPLTSQAQKSIKKARQRTRQAMTPLLFRERLLRICPLIFGVFSSPAPIRTPFGLNS